MRIKRRKQMRLDELIKYVWEHGVENETYRSDMGNTVSIGVQGLMWTNSIIGRDDTFTVETEEELTEETELPAILTGVKGDDGRMIYRQHTFLSINRVKEGAAVASIKPIVIYATDFNTPINEITLIWSKDTGIPEEGVIEE